MADDRDGYSPHEHRPLAAYAVLAGAFDTGLAAFALRCASREEALPERVPARDLLLMSAATQKLSRMIAKDKVTSFLRAPFTRYTGPGGPGEVTEEPRGTGLRLAIGELLGCPYCLGLWVVAGFTAGYVQKPRTTRLVAGMFSALTVADFLQLAYAAAEERV